MTFTFLNDFKEYIILIIKLLIAFSIPKSYYDKNEDLLEAV